MMKLATIRAPMARQLIALSMEGERCGFIIS